MPDNNYVQMVHVDIISKSVNKHAKGMIETKIKVGRDSKAANILRSLHMPTCNHDLGKEINLRKLEGCINEPFVEYLFKATREDLSLALVCVKGFTYDDVAVILLPEFIPDKPNVSLKAMQGMKVNVE